MTKMFNRLALLLALTPSLTWALVGDSIPYPTDVAVYRTVTLEVSEAVKTCAPSRPAEGHSGRGYPNWQVGGMRTIEGHPGSVFEVGAKITHLGDVEPATFVANQSTEVWATYRVEIDHMQMQGLFQAWRHWSALSEECDLGDEPFSPSEWLRVKRIRRALEEPIHVVAMVAPTGDGGKQLIFVGEDQLEERFRRWPRLAAFLRLHLPNYLFAGEFQQRGQNFEELTVMPSSGQTEATYLDGERATLVRMPMTPNDFSDFGIESVNSWDRSNALLHDFAMTTTRSVLDPDLSTANIEVRTVRKEKVTLTTVPA